MIQIKTYSYLLFNRYLFQKMEYFKIYYHFIFHHLNLQNYHHLMDFFKLLA